LRWGNWVGNGHGQNRYTHESTTRHSTLHPPCKRSSLDRTSNAKFDKPDIVRVK
jgi:hypothetical protein